MRECDKSPIWSVGYAGDETKDCPVSQSGGISANVGAEMMMGYFEEEKRRVMAK